MVSRVDREPRMSDVLPMLAVSGCAFGLGFGIGSRVMAASALRDLSELAVIGEHLEELRHRHRIRVDASAAATKTTRCTVLHEAASAEGGALSFTAIIHVLAVLWLLNSSLLYNVASSTDSGKVVVASKHIWGQVTNAFSNGLSGLHRAIDAAIDDDDKDHSHHTLIDPIPGAFFTDHEYIRTKYCDKGAQAPSPTAADLLPTSLSIRKNRPIAPQQIEKEPEYFDNDSVDRLKAAGFASSPSGVLFNTRRVSTEALQKANSSHSTGTRSSTPSDYDSGYGSWTSSRTRNTSYSSGAEVSYRVSFQVPRTPSDGKIAQQHEQRKLELDETPPILASSEKGCPTDTHSSNQSAETMEVAQQMTASEAAVVIPAATVNEPSNEFVTRSTSKAHSSSESNEETTPMLTDNGTKLTEQEAAKTYKEPSIPKAQLASTVLNEISIPATHAFTARPKISPSSRRRARKRSQKNTVSSHTERKPSPLAKHVQTASKVEGTGGAVRKTVSPVEARGSAESSTCANDEAEDPAFKAAVAAEKRALVKHWMHRNSVWNRLNQEMVCQAEKRNSEIRDWDARYGDDDATDRGETERSSEDETVILTGCEG